MQDNRWLPQTCSYQHEVGRCTHTGAATAAGEAAVDGSQSKSENLMEEESSLDVSPVLVTLFVICMGVMLLLLYFFFQYLGLFMSSNFRQFRWLLFRWVNICTVNLSNRHAYTSFHLKCERSRRNKSKCHTFSVPAKQVRMQFKHPSGQHAHTCS